MDLKLVVGAYCIENQKNLTELKNNYERPIYSSLFGRD